jgi:hypothetical protein
MLFHCNNGCTDAPQCYVIRTLPALLTYYVDLTEHTDTLCVQSGDLLICTVVVLYCFVMCVCVCACVCVGFVMCGCLGNMYTVL